MFDYGIFAEDPYFKIIEEEDGSITCRTRKTFRAVFRIWGTHCDFQWGTWVDELTKNLPYNTSQRNNIRSEYWGKQHYTTKYNRVEQGIQIAEQMYLKLTSEDRLGGIYE